MINLTWYAHLQTHISIYIKACLKKKYTFIVHLNNMIAPFRGSVNYFCEQFNEIYPLKKCL